MTYQAIYKCRLCGEKFKAGTTGKSTALMNMFHILGVQDINKKIYGRPADKQDIHNCEDGSLGLADFQGFKAVEE